ncbi:hypothetical protein HK102_006495 [Quaeritorhiza haematococci]|nr:hypothetical protein HK102_006495 [Quaeritorhiza haematococci]
MASVTEDKMAEEVEMKATAEQGKGGVAEGSVDEMDYQEGEESVRESEVPGDVESAQQQQMPKEARDFPDDCRHHMRTQSPTATSTRVTSHPSTPEPQQNWQGPQRKSTSSPSSETAVAAISPATKADKASPSRSPPSSPQSAGSSSSTSSSVSSSASGAASSASSSSANEGGDEEEGEREEDDEVESQSSADEFVQSLEHVNFATQSFIRALHDNVASKEDIEFFLKEALPTYTLILLEKDDFLDENICDLVNQFLHYVIYLGIQSAKQPLLQDDLHSRRRQRRTITSLPADVPELQNALFRILCDPAQHFYLRTALGMEEEFDLEDVREALAEDAWNGDRLSDYYTNNARFFIQKHGLDVILDRFEQTVPEEAPSEYTFTSLSSKAGKETAETAEEQSHHYMSITTMTRLLNQCYQTISQLPTEPEVHHGQQPQSNAATEPWTPDEYLYRLCDAIVHHIKRIPEASLRSEDKKTIQRLAQMIHQVLWDVTDPEMVRDNIKGEYAVEVVRFELVLACRCFKSSSLDKRLWGLAQIKEVIKHWAISPERKAKMTAAANASVTGGEAAFGAGVGFVGFPGVSATGAGPNRMELSPSSTVLSHFPVKPPTKTKPEKYLLRWLRRERILSHMFGPNIHLEVVARCADLLHFVICLDDLGEDGIDIIWTPVVTNQHRSIIHGVYSLLHKLCPAMYPHQIALLIRKIRTSVPRSNVDPQLVGLVTGCISAAIRLAGLEAAGPDHVQASRTAAFDGYLYLWELLQDEESATSSTALAPTKSSHPPTSSLTATSDSADSVSDGGPATGTTAMVIGSPVAAADDVVEANVASIAFQQLQMFLVNGPQWREERAELMRRCLEKLHNHAITPYTLRVIQALLASSKWQDDQDRWSYLEDLFDRQGLSRHFFDDLRHVKKAATVARSRTRTRTRTLSRASVSTLGAQIETQQQDSVDTVAMPNESTNILVGKQSYAAHICHRLDFLHFMLGAFSNGPHFVRNVPEDIVKLWDLLVMDALTPQEREDAFVAFVRILGVGSEDGASNQNREQSHPKSGDRHGMDEYSHGDRFPDVFASVIFEHCLARLGVRSLSEAGFHFVRNCFVKVNALQGRIVCKNDDDVHVVDDPLGVEFIWNIALHSRDEKVGTRAIEFIVQLHLNVERNSLRQRMEDLIDVGSTHLYKAADALAYDFVPSAGEEEDLSESVAEEELKFTRCLALYKIYIDSFTRKYSDLIPPESASAPRHGLLKRGQDLEVQVQIISQKTARLLIFNEYDNVGVLRIKVAREMGGIADLSLLRLISAGRELKDDTQFLKDLKVLDMMVTVTAIRRPAEQSEVGTKVATLPSPQEQREQNLSRALTPEGARMTADDDEDTMGLVHPSAILAMPKYHDHFFGMLELKEKQSSEIWNLLMQLPTNELLMDRLRTLPASYPQSGMAKSNALAVESQIMWDALLDKHCAYRLLYALQIVDHLQKQDENLNVDEVRSWKHRFHRLGGVNHLLHVLIDTDMFNNNLDGSATKSCLALLLRVIDGFPIDHWLQPKYGAILTLLMKKLASIEVAVASGSSTASSEDDTSIAAGAMKLILRFAVQTGDGLGAFADILSDKEWLMSVLVKCNKKGVRDEVAHQLVTFCNQSLVNNITQDSLERVPALQQDMHMPSLFSVIINHIWQHPIKENSADSEQDCCITGLFRMAQTILQNFPQLKADQWGTRLIDVTFNDCLFNIPSMEDIDRNPVPPKCKTDGSRAAAFEVLDVLVNGCQTNFFHITDLLLKQLNRGNINYDVWNYCPKAVQKASCGYVGLQNLGATCYMNSIMQQFFMIPSFRNGILAAKSGDENKEDNLLYQLQVLFSHLQHSEKKAYETSSFCRSYKDYDGNPMNVTVQMDVDEYFNLLFDRLENILKDTPQAILFKKHFGGKLLQQIKSRDCEHISEREESFFAIQCEVKNKKSVEESLQSYIEGEMLDGDNKYYCSKCGKHVDAIKRACIKSLPDTLIVHLKRFDFDMEAMKRVKINDYFEFPSEVNMEPYTLDYLSRKESGPGDTIEMQIEAQEALYELVGILVHSGTADSGHYYSFIKERSPRFPNAERGWFHFNDSVVEPFDPNNIANLCFGGVDSSFQWDEQQKKNVARFNTKTYNAYMLFYDRVGAVHDGVTKVPDDVFKTIWDQNRDFLNDKNIYDAGYFQFIWKVTQSLSSDQLSQMSDGIDLQFRLIELGTRFFIGTLAHAKDRANLGEWVAFLKNHIEQHLDGCIWFLTSIFENQSTLDQLLLLCYVADVREAFVELVISAIMTLRKAWYAEADDNGMITEISPDTSSDHDMNATATKYEMAISTYIVALGSLLPKAFIYWRHFDEYFYLLLRISELGSLEREIMVKKGLLRGLIDFYLADLSPLVSDPKLREFRKMGDRFNSPNFTNLTSLLKSLLTSCDLSTSAEIVIRRRGQTPTEGVATVPNADLIELSWEDAELLFCVNGADMRYVTFWKLLRERDIQNAIDILIHACFSNQIVSHDIILYLVKEIIVQEVTKPFLEALYHVLRIDDECTPLRVTAGFNFLHQVVKPRVESHPNIVHDCLNFLYYLCSSPGVGPEHAAQVHLIDIINKWFQDVLLNSPFHDSRQLVVNVFLSVFGDQKTPNRSIPAQKNVKRALNALVSLLPHAREVLRAVPQQHAGKAPYGWRVAQYLHLLRSCVRTHEDKQLLLPAFDQICALGREIMKQQTDCDANIREYLMLLHMLLKSSPTYLDKFTSSESIRKDLLEMKVIVYAHDSTNMCYLQVQDDLWCLFHCVLFGTRVNNFLERCFKALSTTPATTLKDISLHLSSMDILLQAADSQELTTAFNSGAITFVFLMANNQLGGSQDDNVLLRALKVLSTLFKKLETELFGKFPQVQWPNIIASLLNIDAPVTCFASLLEIAHQDFTEFRTVLLRNNRELPVEELHRMFGGKNSPFSDCELLSSEDFDTVPIKTPLMLHVYGPLVEQLRTQPTESQSQDEDIYAMYLHCLFEICLKFSGTPAYSTAIELFTLLLIESVPLHLTLPFQYLQRILDDDEATAAFASNSNLVLHLATDLMEQRPAAMFTDDGVKAWTLLHQCVKDSLDPDVVKEFARYLLGQGVQVAKELLLPVSPSVEMTTEEGQSDAPPAPEKSDVEQTPEREGMISKLSATLSIFMTVAEDCKFDIQRGTLEQGIKDITKPNPPSPSTAVDDTKSAPEESSEPTTTSSTSVSTVAPAVSQSPSNDKIQNLVALLERLQETKDDLPLSPMAADT